MLPTVGALFRIAALLTGDTPLATVAVSVKFELVSNAAALTLCADVKFPTVGVVVCHTEL